jgi:D-alanyl-D-alanine carboxypeptidase
VFRTAGRLVLKVSYNIGADTSLVLFGLTQGVDTMDAALQMEKQNLSLHYGIDASEYSFVDGSGGGQTKAINRAVTHMLDDMYHSRDFASFFDALPILGTDGSLSTFKDYEKDPSLADATSKVRAKTGTFLEGGPDGLIVRGQAFGGYIEAKSGRKLAYQLVVNEVPITGLDDLITIFQNEATISAIPGATTRMCAGTERWFRDRSHRNKCLL